MLFAACVVVCKKKQQHFLDLPLKTGAEQSQKHSASEYRPNFKPTLGLATAVSIVVGGVIGSGIFKKPAAMAQELDSPELLLAVWLVAGILTLFGALTNAEIAGMISETGGQYVFFREMYGKFFSYLYGWSMFAVVQTASIASITYVFAEAADTFLHLPHLSASAEKFSIHLPFIGDIFPLKDIGIKLLTSGAILLLSAVNYIGAVFGGAVQMLFTSLKVAALAAIIALAFFSGTGSAANYISAGTSSVMPQGWALAGAVVAALSGAFWAFDGWNNITYIAGETREPQRNIPRSLFAGMAIIIVVYMLINLAYLYILPVNVMAQSGLVAVDVIAAILGKISPQYAALATGIIAFCIMISTFGTSNGTILATARIYFAMSLDGLFFKSTGKLHNKFRTPANALAIQAVWSCVLTFSGTFDTLTDTLIFVSWLFYMLGALGVFILRKKMPDVPRPYRVWGYPAVPAIFVIFAAAFVIMTLYNDTANYLSGNAPIINSAFGLALVGLGVPFYAYFTRKHRSE